MEKAKDLHIEKKTNWCSEVQCLYMGRCQVPCFEECMAHYLAATIFAEDEATGDFQGNTGSMMLN